MFILYLHKSYVFNFFEKFYVILTSIFGKKNRYLTHGTLMEIYALGPCAVDLVSECSSPHLMTHIRYLVHYLTTF